MWEELKTGVVGGQVAFFVAIPLDLWPGEDGGDGKDGDPRDGIDHVDDERDEDIICITGELLRSFQRLEMLWEKKWFSGIFPFFSLISTFCEFLMKISHLVNWSVTALLP